MIEFITANGYVYLFLLSFLAATIVPAGSEWLLAALLAKSLNPPLLLVSATTGNFLGACTTYYIGLTGGRQLLNRVFKVNHKTQDYAEKVYYKYGSWSLLFSWIPVIGDPLCLTGGLFRIPFPVFAIMVFIGKLARYSLIVLIVLKFI